MHVDDRLATVLAVSATGENQIRVQYRQLLDLIGTTPAGARSALLDAALLRLGELARAIPVAERVGAVAEPGLRLRNPRLVAELAQDHGRVAAAAVARARLSDEQWLDLLPVLPAAARARLRERPDIGERLRQRLAQLGDAPAGLPASPGAATSASAVASGATAEPAAAGAAEPVATTGDGIGAIVRRIAAYRRNRDIAVAANDAPQLPLSPEVPSTPIQAFTFACDPDGRIVATDAAVAGMTVGLLLPFVANPAERIGDLFAKRQPIRLAAVSLEGAPRIAGPWILDAVPEFDPAGRFAGYVGKMRRPAGAAAPARPAAEGDRLRQVLHELRTPVNAIQGFAELIQQQLMGAVPHGYRAVAASIAADAAQMLAGFEELDRLARLDGGTLVLPAGSCDLAVLVARIREQLESFTAPRHSGFTVTGATDVAIARMDQDEAERLLWRLLATFASLTAPGETLALAFARRGDAVALDMTMPTALAALDDPLGAAPLAACQPVSGSQFGTGFALRLATAEAAAAGGSLVLKGGKALLMLPFAGPLAAMGGLTAPDGVSNPADQVSASTAG
ncbi:MAG TPA: histidine kinase dimerization/phospho-acceptor domain-containing protein [Novosphingobium sp.]